MVLGQMLTLLRRRIRDQNKIVWTSDVDLREELNLHAANVLRLLQRHQMAQLDSNSEDFVTAAGVTAYPLTAIINRPWKVEQVFDPPSTARVPCVQIPEGAEDWRSRSLFDRRGRWHYWLTRSAATLLHSIVFPAAPAAGLTFRVHYLIPITPLATDGTNDNDSYLQIPVEYHELVVQEAVLTTLDPASTLYDGAIRHRDRLASDLITDVSKGTHPIEILDENQ